MGVLKAAGMGVVGVGGCERLSSVWEVEVRMLEAVRMDTAVLRQKNGCWRQQERLLDMVGMGYRDE